MSTAVRAVPADDEDARRRIRNSLDESLIVEASAGTGKTSELVRRIVAVIAAGLTTIDRIAAVTFTNKAAGELKLRLRQELDRARAAADELSERRYHLESALKRLEEASIGTIHSFCAQILRERPVEAVVDPSFQELNDTQQQQLYDRAFRGWIQQMLGETSPGLRRALIRLAWRDTRDAAPPLEQLKSAGRQLIEWRDYPAKWERVHFEREAEIDALAARVRDLAPRVNYAFRAIQDLALWIDRYEAVRERDYDTLESLLLKLLRELTGIKKKGAEELIMALEDFRRNADGDLAFLLKNEMEGLVARYEQIKRQSGQLDFLDLLILAGSLVRENGEVRRYLQNRFTHIFVDEFQDTDPQQAELLLLLAADDPKESNWLNVRPAAGKLFVVGDPKQSIYKFRRADVVLYRELRDRLSARGVGVVRLTRSFRSVRPLQQFVNAAFAFEMTGDVESGQAEYSPLEERRAGFEGQPAVVVVPPPRPYGTRNVSRPAIAACLPDAVAAYLDWLFHHSGWRVQDPDTGKEGPVAARHVCILFRRFTSFGRDITRDYTRGLEARGIPHLLVGSKGFHEKEEVETLRAALTAVEWPEDELSVFATLKGSLFAIRDETLLKYRHQHKRLHPFAPVEEDLPDEFQPVKVALETLADLHRRRNWRPVAETVNLLLEATRAHAGFALRPAGQQTLANVYRMADLARSYEIDGGISFRGFIEMLERLLERAESAEAPVLEEGSDGVRLMTVHAAKGLEFPVVVLADIGANLSAREPDRYVDSARQLCAMRLLGCTPWELLHHRDREITREAAEGVRVAYVAATRARDLLVVPAVGDQELEGSWLSPLSKAVYPDRNGWRRSEPAAGCPKFGESSVLERPQDLANEREFSVRPGLHRPHTGEHDVVWWDPAALRLGVEANFGLRQEEVLAEASDESLERYEGWKSARAVAIERGGAPTFDIFTPSESRERPQGFAGEIRVEETARAVGRPYGPRFGTLMHAVLRDVPFDAGRDTVESMVRLQSRLMGAPVEEEAAAVEAIAAALAHPVLAAARSAERVQREWPVSYRDGVRLLEGIVDLAFWNGGAWEIVDYKTDSDFPLRRRHYETQLAWYVHAVSVLTGNPVRGCLFRV